MKTAKYKPLKKVSKPWGYEIWLALNDKYCFKQLVIHKGHRFSLQYHKIKRETIFIESGQANVTIDGGLIQCNPGDVLDITPGMEHRIEAVTDLVLYEASTPEVNDVVRIGDDYGRKGT